MTPKIVLDLPEESPAFAVEPTLVDRAPRKFPEQELETRKVDMDRLCVEYEDIDAEDVGLDPSMFDRPPWGDGGVVKEVTVLAEPPPPAVQRSALDAIPPELAEKLKALANEPPRKTQLGWKPAPPPAKGTLPPPVRQEPEAIIDAVEDDFDAAFDAAFDMSPPHMDEDEPVLLVRPESAADGEVVAEMALPLGSAPVELPAELPPPPIAVAGPVVIHPTNGSAASSAPAIMLAAREVSPVAEVAQVAVETMDEPAAELLPPPIELPPPAELVAAPVAEMTAELPPAIALPEPMLAAEPMPMPMPEPEPEPMTEPEPVMAAPMPEPEPVMATEPAPTPEPEPMIAATPEPAQLAPEPVVVFTEPAQVPVRLARVMPLPPPPDFAPVEIPVDDELEADEAKQAVTIEPAPIAEPVAVATPAELSPEPVAELTAEPAVAEPVAAEPVAAEPEMAVVIDRPPAREEIAAEMSAPEVTALAVEAAAVEAPAVEAPAVEASVSDVPAVEAPADAESAEASAAEASATEASAAEAPRRRAARGRAMPRRRNRGFPKDNPFKPKPEPTAEAPIAAAPIAAAPIAAAPTAEPPAAAPAPMPAEIVRDEQPPAPVEAPAETAIELAPAPVALVPVRQASAQRRGQVIVFFGCRGGAGTTTLATNFAGELAKAGEETLLVDMDLELGDALANLGLEASGGTFTGLTREFESLKDDALKRRLAQHRSGLYVLAQSGRREELDREFVQRMPALLDHLRRRFDTTIIDGIREFNDVALAAVAAADTVALVLTQDVGAIRRARRVLDLFDKLGVPMEKRTLIVNRFQRFSKHSDKEIERALGLHVAAHVRTADGAAQRAQTRGTLVAEVARLKGIVRDLRKMTHLVTINPVI